MYFSNNGSANDVLRKMYEQAILAGDLTNKNEIQMNKHNFIENVLKICFKLLNHYIFKLLHQLLIVIKLFPNLHLFKINDALEAGNFQVTLKPYSIWSPVGYYQVQ